MSEVKCLTATMKDAGGVSRFGVLQGFCFLGEKQGLQPKTQLNELRVNFNVLLEVCIPRLVLLVDNLHSSSLRT